MNQRTLIGSAVVAALLTPCLGLADDAPTAGASADSLQEVIVTAERRESDVEKTALSVSVVNGATLEQQGDTDIAHVLEEVPGVTLQGLGASSVGGSGGPPLIDIRGVGTDGPNKNSATAVYEDGVLVTGGNADFYDVNRVEILRGPQGTLYGRGATGGAVNIITNTPTQTFGGYGQLTIGSYSLVGTQAALNAPLSDDIAARLSFDTIKHRGYFNTGESGEGDTSARLKILYKPNDNFSLLLGGVYYTADQSDPGQIPLSSDFTQPTQWVTSSAAAGRDTIEYREGYANLNWNMGFGQLTYIPSYQATHSSNSTYLGMPGLQINLMPYNNTFQQELRVASEPDAPFSWIGGLYYFNQHFFQGLFGEAPGTTGIGSYTPAFSVSQGYANSSAAVFGEVTYPITSALRATGGVRESRDSVFHSDFFSFQGPDFFSKTYTHFDWKARLEGDVAPGSLLYGMVSTGYRPGGGVNGQGYAPEVLTAYEIGSKNRIGSSVILNGSVFYYHYSGFQAPESYNFPMVITTVLSIPAKVLGAELEGEFLLTPDDKLTLSGTYLNAQFTANTGFTNTTNQVFTPFDTDSGTIPHAAKESASASFSHTFRFPNGSTLMPEVDAHYQSKQFTDFDVTDYSSPPNPFYVQRAYTISNASITYAPTDGKFHITVYGKNLGNVMYKTSVSNGNAFVNDPRTVGVIAALNF